MKPPRPLATGSADFIERFTLEDGRMLEVRPTTERDAELLNELFGGLPADDRRLRFFTALRPRPDWCSHWSAIAEHGGFHVVAIVRSDEGDEGDEVIGEAGYAMRQDGDGDLAVTVAAGWRGWLGGYLVDLIRRHASRVGITNLQAEALVDNRPMLRLLRRRGAVTLEHVGNSVRLSIGTSGPTAGWPPLDERPRVLIEVPGSRWSGEAAAQAAGLSTVFCSGPKRREDHGCPALDGGACPLADGADAIVVLLPRDDPDTTALASAHRSAHPGTPVLLRRDVEGAPQGCRTMGSNVSEMIDEIVSAITPTDDS